MKRIIITALLFAFSQTSMATLFSYTDNTANNGGTTDRLDSVSSTFNDQSEAFTFDVDFNDFNAAQTDTNKVNAFWLVIDNGPNPKNADVNELAIMYGDLDNDTLTTYVYNGQNNSNSWSDPGIALQSDVGNGVLTNGANSFSLSLDATDINDWFADPDVGIGFDDNIGIWFHIAIGADYTYDPAFSFSHDYQGWYDIADADAERVPEPSIIALFGLGLVGLGLARRKVRS